MAKEEKKSTFFWIFNQEEQVVAVSYAKTRSGALAKFETTTGYPRDSYRAEEMFFGENSCAVSGNR